MTAGKCILLLLIFLITPLYSQTVLLTTEITTIERQLSNARLPAAERKAALEKMARLYILSGDIERAADSWNRAAQAVPGNAGHLSLYNSALCLTAMGEFDRAESVLQPVLAAAGNRPLQTRGRVLAAQIEALKTGNTRPLSTLISNADFSDYRPQLYYTIWRISGDAAARTRLITDFPQSPEARIVRDDAAIPSSEAVLALPAAHWLLTGFGQSTVQTPAGQSNPAASSSPASSGSPAASGSPVMFQTGSFSREANAQAMSDRLRTAGFTPVINQRTVNGAANWIVGAAPGPDPSRTQQQLRDRGFEFFPVF